MKLHSFKTFILTSVLTILGGCGTYFGAIGGSAVSGGLSGGILAAQLNPSYWPFEEDPKILELKCGGKPTEIALSSIGATLVQTGEETKFQRDYSGDGNLRLRYFHMAVVDQHEEELIVNEKSQPAYKVWWLSVPDEQTAELELDGVSVACKQIERETM